jgi:protein involved in polysaccharide export with SLBB domain
MCTDPVDGDTATLVLTCEDTATLETVRDAIEQAGGSVEAELQYHAFRVQIPEPAVSGLTDIDGLESIKTDNAVGIGGDAGEDV